MPKEQVKSDTSATASILITQIPPEDLIKFDEAIDLAYHRPNMRSRALRAFIKAVGEERIIIKPERIAEPEFQIAEVKANDKKK